MPLQKDKAKKNQFWIFHDDQQDPHFYFRTATGLIVCMYTEVVKQEKECFIFLLECLLKLFIKGRNTKGRKFPSFHIPGYSDVCRCYLFVKTYGPRFTISNKHFNFVTVSA
jgi:hypothetical protein